MKIGPQWMSVTNTAGTSGVPYPGGPVQLPGFSVPTQTYLAQNITVTLSTLPVDGRGLYNKTVQLLGTFSAVTNVVIECSVDPQCVSAPATASWFSIGNLTTPTFALIHSGNVRAMRARILAISSSDNIGIVYMADDAG